MARVLIVEDDPTVAEVVVSYLDRAGHQTWAEHDGQAAASLLTSDRADEIDLVILDLMLPGLDGIEICRLLRQAHPGLPVIMLTALGEEDDRIAGLEVGADDYVTKPFSPRELVLRVESVLRRSQSAPAEPATLITLGPLTIDTAARRATKNGTELYLTARELDLLAYLMARPGRVCPREELLAEVWGYPPGTATRTVDVHVAQLRAKLGDAVTLRNVRGVGYAVEAEVTR